MLGWFKNKFSKSSHEETPESVDSQEETLDEQSDDIQVEEIAKSSSQDDLESNISSEIAKVEEPSAETLLESEEKLVAGENQVVEQTVEQKEQRAEVESEEKPVTEEKIGFFKRLKKGLSRTRESLINRLDKVFLGKKVIDAELLDELEEILITADLGVQTVMDLLDEARNQVARKELSDPQALKSVLKEKMLSYLARSDSSSALVMPENGPFVILVLGVNGVGKTTTIGKLAHKFKQAGNRVMLVAADTFRAAAIDQIKVWGDRIGVEVCAQQPGSDPSSVVFDAFDAANDKKYDVIIVDTAGRIHTKVNLMEELKKIKRVMTKKCPGAPHEVMLVLDATTGQNAVSQAKEFNKAVDITGLTLTKLDGTAKGGIVINISREFDIPIRFIGVGEQMDDLRDFESAEFVKALFDK